MAKVITLDELRTTHGHGYEEMMFSDEATSQEKTEIMECVWINGHIMLEDGCTADANEDIYSASYGQRDGSRIWFGKPTDEQRRMTPWGL